MATNKKKKELSEIRTEQAEMMLFHKEPVARYLIVTPLGNWWADEIIEKVYGIDLFFEYTKEKEDKNRSWKTSVHTIDYAILDYEHGLDLEDFKNLKKRLLADDQKHIIEVT